MGISRANVVRDILSRIDTTIRLMYADMEQDGVIEYKTLDELVNLTQELEFTAKCRKIKRNRNIEIVEDENE